MLRVGVLGASGYSGQELMRLLGRHPRVEAVALEGEDRGGDFKQIVGDRRLDLLFLATPAEVSLEVAPQALAGGARVVDLSGAFRLRQAEDYPRWYGFAHPTPELLSQAVYGLPELNRAAIRTARLVANPGCYPTAVTLGLHPLVAHGLVDREAGLICDAKSGVTGAGHKPSSKTHFCAVQENFTAYGILVHRHVPEMVQNLGLSFDEFCFTAHLLPVRRGILATIYAKLQRRWSQEELTGLYRRCYEAEAFVRLRREAPDLQGVQGSNYCDLHITLDAAGHRAVIVAAIDNLIKGAAGQALQNMNLMLGWKETEGLPLV